MLDASVEYAKQRSQFGSIIGSYQAIKHKLADVYIAVEMARPLVYGAALSLADGSTDTARDVSAALVAAADAALLSARSSLQTHGAIGFTQEHDLSLLLLRVQALRSAWGIPDLAPAPGIGGLVMSEERELLRDTVAALVEKHASPGAVREAIESEHGYDESLWKLLCEQVGAAALVVPEEMGGAGGELADAAVVLEELGKALVPTPLLGTTLAELALLAADEPDGGAIEKLAEGASIGAVVFDADYVVNGDIADVVVATDGKKLTRWTTFTATAVDTMDLTRPLARIEPKDTEAASAPIPAWPIPRRSWWRPSRSARRRSAST